MNKYESELKKIPAGIRNMILGHWEMCKNYAEAVDAGVASSAIEEMKASMPFPISEEAWSSMYEVGSGKLDMRTFMESPQYLELFPENLKAVADGLRNSKEFMDTIIASQK